MIAIVGLTSNPAFILSAYISLTKAPKGSKVTILLGSPHCGCGPILAAGCVFLKFGKYSGSNAPKNEICLRLPVLCSYRTTYQMRLPGNGKHSRTHHVPQWHFLHRLFYLCSIPARALEDRQLPTLLAKVLTVLDGSLTRRRLPIHSVRDACHLLQAQTYLFRSSVS